MYYSASAIRLRTACNNGKFYNREESYYIWSVVLSYLPIYHFLGLCVSIHRS
ncbi:unnamed protein product [Linum tenue]|uniref:Uncharacterized protein n=1 Tax=Linum tenue TaxID=586396 RepID=A0AAV0JVZ5_9ROSI|nr:unnamed protein product [Linum tenue]